MGGVADCVFHLGPEAQSGKVNHYLRLTPHTRTHTHQGAAILRSQHSQEKNAGAFGSEHFQRQEDPQNCLALIPKEPPSLRRVMTPSSSQTNAHSKKKKEGERGRHEGSSQREEEELFTVHYFLSQHPLSSRGKSIPKVKGHPGSIPFVPSPMPYMFSTKRAPLSAVESKRARLLSETFLASLIFLLSF